MKKKLLGIGIVLTLLMTATISFAANNNNPPEIEDVHYDLTSNTLWCTPIDQDNDQIRVGVDWDSDTGEIDKWTMFRDSGEEHSIYPVPSGCKQFSVKVEDEHGAQSDWAEIKPKTKQFNFQSLLIDLLEKYSNWFPILRHLLNL
jgi:hypothetical protein